MSIRQYDEAVRLIEDNKSRAFFAGQRDDALVDKAGKALGVKFLPTYKAFVKRFGAGSLGSLEVYGVVDDDFEDSSVPDGVWLTLTERSQVGLPRELVVIGDTGSGEFYCLRTDTAGTECEVIVFEPGMTDSVANAEVIAEDFGAFLLKMVQLQIAGK
jgi:hypothetical protein